MSIPILERERDVGQERMNEKVKNYKSFVENNRKLGQEAIAFGNEVLGGEEQRMKGKRWRDRELRVQGNKTARQ